jgi:hypothetical protein
MNDTSFGTTNSQLCDSPMTPKAKVASGEDRCDLLGRLEHAGGKNPPGHLDVAADEVEGI